MTLPTSECIRFCGPRQSIQHTCTTANYFQLSDRLVVLFFRSIKLVCMERQHDINFARTQVIHGRGRCGAGARATDNVLLALARTNAHAKTMAHICGRISRAAQSTQRVIEVSTPPHELKSPHARARWLLPSAGARSCANNSLKCYRARRRDVEIN